MAAAVKLAESGQICTVFEAAKTLGGRARRITYKGAALDNGQHILSGAYTELLRLMALVGVPDTAFDRVPLNLTFAWPTAGAPTAFALSTPTLPAPLHMAAGLLSAKGLNWAERLAAIRLLRALKKSRFKVDARMSVAEFLRTHQQPTKLIQFLWQPLTISALNTPLATASAQVFANVLRDALAAGRAASDLIFPKVDLSQLFPDPAAHWLAGKGATVKSGVRVTAIGKADAGFDIIYGAGSDAQPEVRETFSHIILAVAPHQLGSFASLDSEIQAIFSNAVDHFQYEPITTIYLAFPPQNTSSTILMPRSMLGRTNGMVQWFFDREALSNQNGNIGVYAGVVSASGMHERWSLDEIATVALRELRDWLPNLPAPLWHKVVHEKRATFACTPNLTRPASETAARGLVLAGDYVACDYPATLEAAVRNGCHAADIVHADM